MWRRTALASTVGVTMLWIVFCLYHHAPKIEAALLSDSTTAVATAGFSGVELRFEGRAAVLEGTVPSQDALGEVERIVRDVDGVQSVLNRLRPATDLATYPVLPFVEILTRPDGVALRGSLANAALRQALSERAIELFGVGRVDDQLIIDASADHGEATARAADVLSAVAQAPAGIRIRLQGDRLRLSGAVASAPERRRIEQQIQAAAGNLRLFFSTLKVATPAESGN